MVHMIVMVDIGDGACGCDGGRGACGCDGGRR